MHLDLPLEQLVKRRGVAFQFAFATEAKELMPQAGDFAAARSVQVREPIMHLRVSMYAEFRDAVKKALRRRAATLSEEYVRSTYCILRYEAPLADLLGFPDDLRRLTAGTAKHWMALSHYAIVTRDPGGRAA